MYGNNNEGPTARYPKVPEYNDPIMRQAMGIRPGDFLPGGVSARGVWNPGETPEVGGFDGGGGGGFSLGGGKPPWWREDSLWSGEVDGGRGIAHLFGNTGMTPGPVPTASPNFNFNGAPAGVSLSGPLSSGGVSLNRPAAFNPRTGRAFSGLAGRW